MAMTKHVGRLISTGKKVAVIFRYMYDDEGNVTDKTHALAVDTDALPNMWVDSFMDAVLSTEGQDTVDFYEVCMRKTLPDGRFILPALVAEGRMRKIRTNDIMMEPDKQVRIPLNELNDNLEIVARGEKEPSGTLKSEDAVEVINQREAAGVNETLGNNKQETRAHQLRAQANMLRADAERMEEEAQMLHPVEVKPRRGRPPKKVETADVTL
tara:strand:+ start:1713 stop:2348 length:636 start_codon:yes stop_codon:yes gene_type:complete